MGTRLELQALLETLLGTDQVYFQAPNNKEMEYPAIVYKIDDVDTKFADDIPYVRVRRYMVTVMHPDPDSDIPDKVGALKRSLFVRAFVSKNLYHSVFTLYF